jgi:uncharacterized protein (DUF1697 family)
MSGDIHIEQGSHLPRRQLFPVICSKVSRVASVMPIYVVLLRGVNVGKGNRIPMAEWRASLEAMGCAGVRTLLNSGNAVVSSSVRSPSSLATAIGDAVTREFGFTTPVIVKSARELRDIIEHAPMLPPTGEHSRFLVAFGPDEASVRQLEPLAALSGANERLLITAQAAYLYCPAGLLSSRIGEAMLGKSDRGVTSRNWATVLKLHALANSR